MVKLTITAVNADPSGKVPAGTFEFSFDTGSNQGFTVSGNKEYADCSFGTDFTKGAQSFHISGAFRLWHPQAGKFLMREGADGPDPPNLASFSLNVDNRVVLTGRKAGTGGTVTVASLGSTFINGSFDVTLGDSHNPEKILHLYTVTGEFRLKN